jgi:hypothetical protein
VNSRLKHTPLKNKTRAPRSQSVHIRRHPCVSAHTFARATSVFLPFSV